MTVPGYPDGAWQGHCAACGASVLVYFHQPWGFSYFETESGPMGTAGIAGLTAHPAPFTHDNPLPVIDRIEPTSGPPGTFTLTVYGRNFDTAGSIVLDGDDHWTTVLADEATAEITAPDAFGPCAVRFINTDGVLSDEVTFTFT